MKCNEYQKKLGMSNKAATIFDLSLSSPFRLGINAEADSEGSLKEAVKKEDFGIHVWQSGGSGGVTNL